MIRIYNNPIFVKLIKDFNVDISFVKEILAKMKKNKHTIRYLIENFKTLTYNQRINENIESNNQVFNINEILGAEFENEFIVKATGNNLINSEVISKVLSELYTIKGNRLEFLNYHTFNKNFILLPVEELYPKMLVNGKDKIEKEQDYFSKLFKEKYLISSIEDKSTNFYLTYSFLYKYLTDELFSGEVAWMFNSFNPQFFIISEESFDKIYNLYMCPSENEIRNFSLQEDLTIFLKSLLIKGITDEVSDIHFEPNYENKFRIAFRKDGLRETFIELESDKIQRIYSLIKQAAKLQVQVTRTKQDGQIADYLNDLEIDIKRLNKNKVKYNFNNITFRVSTYPNQKENSEQSAESIVIRILNSKGHLVDINNLGLTNLTVSQLKKISKNRQGIILITGPTGSGKTTTLYSLLNTFNYIEEKIITFEDPVEIRNKYWTQGQKTETEQDNMNFTFIEAKQAILRQDPDIILMGEIRDEESAQFALECANTGHLVLATLHSNSGIDTINRLKELKVKKDEIASSILCVSAQRLVPALCDKCKEDLEINSSNEYEVKKIQTENKNVILKQKGKGCVHCNFTGIKGKVLIDEIFTVHEQDEIQQGIYLEKSVFEIKDISKKNGIVFLKENAKEKFIDGKIDLNTYLKI